LLELVASTAFFLVKKFFEIEGIEIQVMYMDWLKKSINVLLYVKRTIPYSDMVTCALFGYSTY
jgi:hypothetical protein